MRAERSASGGPVGIYIYMSSAVGGRPPLPPQVRFCLAGWGDGGGGWLGRGCGLGLAILGWLWGAEGCGHVVLSTSTVGGGCSSMCYGRSCAHCMQAGMSELVVAD